MISRTLIRIKAFKELYSRVATGSTDTAAAEKELFQAFEQTRRLYALMALLPVALQTMAQDKILKQKRKFNPDIEIINECSKFASNPFSVLLKADSAFMNWCNNHAVSWSEFETSLKDIYARICSREYFKEYIALDNPQMGDALKLFHRIYSEELDDNTVLEDALENSNIWWLEDLEYVLLMLLNNLPAIAERQQVEIPELFDSREDEAFARKLVGTVLVNYDDLVETVSANMTNWEIGRVVLSDMLIVSMGIAEAQTFSNIPLKVTINEYIEIAKYYSTPKSYSFVNGLLNRILKDMYADGRIVKDPRGMIGGLE